MKHVSLPDFLDIIEYDFDTETLKDYKAIGDKTAIREMKGKKCDVKDKNPCGLQNK